MTNTLNACYCWSKIIKEFGHYPGTVNDLERKTYHKKRMLINSFCLSRHYKTTKNVSGPYLNMTITLLKLSLYLMKVPVESRNCASAICSKASIYSDNPEKLCRHRLFILSTKDLERANLSIQRSLCPHYRRTRTWQIRCSRKKNKSHGAILLGRAGTHTLKTSLATKK